MQVLIVDGANVVGSRPDGWWRDRPGAAHRLHAQLVAADLAQGEIVLVLEGAATRGVQAEQDRRVRTVHAPGSGDDTVVELVSAYLDAAEDNEVVVVTADRVLRQRVEAAGARCVGPSWLLDRL